MDLLVNNAFTPPPLAELVDIDLAEVAITSAATLVEGEGPPEAFRLDDVKGVAVEVRLAQGTKCARSWKILASVGSDLLLQHFLLHGTSAPEPVLVELVDQVVLPLLRGLGAPAGPADGSG